MVKTPVIAHVKGDAIAFVVGVQDGTGAVIDEAGLLAKDTTCRGSQAKLFRHFETVNNSKFNN